MDAMGLSHSQGTGMEKVEQDGGREKEKGDICGCCDFQLRFAQNHRPGPHPQRFWERRRGTMRDDRHRENETGRAT